jgi:hypothetical protein
MVPKVVIPICLVLLAVVVGVVTVVYIRRRRRRASGALAGNSNPVIYPFNPTADAEMPTHIAEPESNGVREMNSSDSPAVRFINVDTAVKRPHGGDTRLRVAAPAALGRAVSTDGEQMLESQFALAAVMRKLETIEVEIRQTRQGSVAQGSNNVEPLDFNDLPPDYESQAHSQVRR